MQPDHDFGVFPIDAVQTDAGFLTEFQLDLVIQVTERVPFSESAVLKVKILHAAVQTLQRAVVDADAVVPDDQRHPVFLFLDGDADAPFAALVLETMYD